MLISGAAQFQKPGVSLASVSCAYSPVLFFLALWMVLHLSLIITLVSSSRKLPSRFPSMSTPASSRAGARVCAGKSPKTRDAGRDGPTWLTSPRLSFPVGQRTSFKSSARQPSFAFVRPADITKEVLNDPSPRRGPLLPTRAPPRGARRDSHLA